MSVIIQTTTLIGLDAHRVDVEADILPGLPKFTIVGLPDAAVQEARSRVRSALSSSGFGFPYTVVTINLAPADIRKTGTHFDLPIALSILAAQYQIPAESLEHRIFLGELALDGTLRGARGVLSAALYAAASGARELIIPVENGAEAALIPGISVRVATSIQEVVQHLLQTKPLPPHPGRALSLEPEAHTLAEFATVRGQGQVKRALEIAAAGGHNILLQGPPGSGKTLLARTLPSILPRMTIPEALETTRIFSVAGLLPKDGYISTRPFRAPHHSASSVALVGGGPQPKPGEISLAHRGVLFLDELPEFPRHILEHLRQPLEDGSVTIARANGTCIYPARFLMVGAMNPCPCGYATDPEHACTCRPGFVEKYQQRLSGPLLDRIDLVVEAPRVPTAQLTGVTPEETSAQVRVRVQSARDRQIQRFQKTSLITNSELTSADIQRLIPLSTTTSQLLQQAVNKLQLSARAYFRLIKVARTIADLSEEEDIRPDHVAEAMQYRIQKER